MVLVNTNDELDILPWEYLYSPEGFLVLEFPFVRGLPPEQRIAPPILDKPLHIVAVPSNPLSPLVKPLNIDAEWWRLKEIVEPLPFDIRLERVRPPTLQQVRSLISNKRQSVIHFMGHGEHIESGAVLCFEKEDGNLDLVGARELIARIRGTTFLITLNACMSASPGPTVFSNLASSIVQAKIPYALGMRFSIYDEDALAFSRMFYTELTQGTSVEEALLQARLSLAERPLAWAVGVPVLYTSLSTPAYGFINHAGTSHIDEHQPRIEVSSIARAVGAFQGRVDDLKSLGHLLTGNKRARILTIHGGSGQGKTALAREAIERFAYAWPGGVWGIMLDPLPDRTRIVNDLAQFLGIHGQKADNPEDREHQVLRLLATRRVLLVLDNAETLVDAVNARDSQAIALTEFIQQLPGASVSLLITSRVQFGWPDEITHELGGLTMEEGARLFQQCAPGRQEAISTKEAQELSQKLEGHPLSLRLLGGAFNASALSLPVFIQDYEMQLVNAENKYVGEDHRHRQLYASMETSIRYLNDEQRHLLRNLWIFQAPFLPDIAASIFDPDSEETDSTSSAIYTQLSILWQRGLLACITITARDDTQDLYYLLPTTRLYIQTYMQSTSLQEEILHRYGEAYELFTYTAYEEMDQSASIVAIIQQTEKDLEQGIQYADVSRQMSYKAYWAAILSRLGKALKAQGILEEVLEQVQGSDQLLELDVLSILGRVYNTIGQPQQALALYQQALTIKRKIGNRTGEASTLANMAFSYHAIGQTQRAFALYEQALPLARESGDCRTEATILTNMANAYHAIGQPQRALDLYEQALPITREIGDRDGEAILLNSNAIVFKDTGKPQRALDLYEQALPIAREMGNRDSEASTLNNIALLYKDTGKPQRALDLYKQALPITREIGNRSLEATVLGNMAGAYQAIGQLQQALTFYEQALPITREIGKRSLEATTLTCMGLLYQDMGLSQRALAFYEQALPITREIGDRKREVTILISMGLSYQSSDQLQQALAFYEQALPITREIGARDSEATLFNNMGRIYEETDQPQQALDLYEQALPIMREVGDRTTEASILNNMGGLYQDMDQPQRALDLYEQALLIRREVRDRQGEATTLARIGMLYHDADQPQRALPLYEQALELSREIGDRATETTILTYIAMLYQATNQLQRALPLYEQALGLSREIGDRVTEAETLVFIGLLHRTTSQVQDAILAYEQAIPILRELGDRATEAKTLTSIGMLYHDTDEPQRAFPLYEQALPLLRELEDRATEATVLFCMGNLFYTVFKNPHKSLQCMQQVQYILEHHDVSEEEMDFTLEEVQKAQKEVSQNREAEKITQPGGAKRIQSLWKAIRWPW
nr:tetratricopeptide repeat protein [Ktedonobacter robiniae]